MKYKSVYKYKQEEIPDDDFLLRRAPYSTFNQKTKKFTASAFALKYVQLKMKRKKVDCFSVNWNKYATPKFTSIDPVYKNEYCVGQFKAIVPRKNNLDVCHTPSVENKSHSTIYSNKKLNKEEKFRLQEIIADNCIPIYFPDK
jgi:hypothetical protein